MRSSLLRRLLLVWLASGSIARGQDKYKVEKLAQAPPAELSAAIRAELAEAGYRISTQDDKPYLELWLRKATPAKSKPNGPDGAIQFPFLSEGDLLGAVRFVAEGHDYRDQTIVPAVYTVRYGQHPVNGDHLGVAPFRDFALILPAKSDTLIKPLARKELERGSADAAGSNHPAVFLIRRAGAMPAPPGSLHHDAEKDLWLVVLPLTVRVGESADSAVLPIELVFDGIAAQ